MPSLGSRPIWLPTSVDKDKMSMTETKEDDKNVVGSGDEDKMSMTETKEDDKDVVSLKVEVIPPECARIHQRNISIQWLMVGNILRRSIPVTHLCIVT